MSRTRRWSAGLLLILAFSAAAAGKTYRWVDAQGKLHYGDQPPANAVPVTPKLATGDNGSGSPASGPPAAALAPEECARRKSQLDGYRDASAITETDGLGNKREYTEDQRKQLIARTEQSIRDGCPN